MHSRISLNASDWIIKNLCGEDWRLRNSQLSESRDLRRFGVIS